MSEFPALLISRILYLGKNGNFQLNYFSPFISLVPTQYSDTLPLHEKKSFCITILAQVGWIKERKKPNILVTLHYVIFVDSNQRFI